MLLASLLATLPAMVVSEAVASPINPAQTIIQPPADHHWVSNKNYPERSVDMCPLAGSLDRCRLLAQTCRPGMSAMRSLSEVNRTLSEKPDSVEIDNPQRTFGRLPEFGKTLGACQSVPMRGPVPSVIVRGRANISRGLTAAHNRSNSTVRWVSSPLLPLMRAIATVICGQSMNAQSLNKLSALPCAIRARSAAETGICSRNARALAIEP